MPVGAHPRLRREVLWQKPQTSSGIQNSGS